MKKVITLDFHTGNPGDGALEYELDRITGMIAEGYHAGEIYNEGNDESDTAYRGWWDYSTVDESGAVIGALAPAPLPVMQQAERALVAAYGEPGPEPKNLESKQGRDAILAVRVMLDWHKRVEAHVTPPAAIQAERERIASALDEEAAVTPDAEDAMVVRDCARLVRADFSYDEAERLTEKEGDAPKPA